MGRLADRDRAKARLKRRSAPIHAYVGANGTGKSALMVYDTLPSLDHGRKVLSTVRLLDYRDPHLCGERPWDVCDDPDDHEREAVAVDQRPALDYEEWIATPYAQTIHPKERRRVYAETVPMITTRVPTGVMEVHPAAHVLYVPFREFAQLLSWRDGDVLMDEVTGIASSRDSNGGGGIPGPVLTYLVQLRRKNTSLRWSCPAWARADKVIREVSTCATLMWGAAPIKAPPAEDGTPRLWHQKRLFLARTYDTSVLEEFTAAKAEKIPTQVKAYYWGPGSLMFRAYDTYKDVGQLGWASDAGRCVGCGGKRAAKPCKCPADVPLVPVEPVRPHPVDVLAANPDAADLAPVPVLL